MLTMRRFTGNERGFVLGMSIIMAFMFAIAAYADLMLAVSQSQHTRFWKDHPSAKYAAEAGLIIARERMINSRLLGVNYCGPLGVNPWNEQVDSNADDAITADDLTIQITINNCAAASGQTVTSKVVY
jgi:Tfp pilus assembly protein PilX